MTKKITLIIGSAFVYLIGIAEMSPTGSQDLTLDRTAQTISYQGYAMTPSYPSRGELDATGLRSPRERGVDRNSIGPGVGPERTDNAWRALWKDIGFDVKRHAYWFTRKAHMMVRAMQETSRFLSIVAAESYSSGWWRLFTVSETATASS